MIKINTEFQKFITFADGKGDDDIATVYDAAEKMEVRKGAGGDRVSVKAAIFRGELADFITDGAVTKYDNLDKTTQTKVHIIMGILIQNSPINLRNSHTVALHLDNADLTYSTIGTPEVEYKLELGKDGSLTISMQMKYPQVHGVNNHVTDLDYGLKTGTLMLDTNKKSSIEYGFTLQIDGKTLDRLAKYDFATYDDAPANAVTNCPDCLLKVTEKIAKPFRFVDDLKVTCSATLHFD